MTTQQKQYDLDILNFEEMVALELPQEEIKKQIADLVQVEQVTRDKLVMIQIRVGKLLALHAATTDELEHKEYLNALPVPTLTLREWQYVGENDITFVNIKAAKGLQQAVRIHRKEQQTGISKAALATVTLSAVVPSAYAEEIKIIARTLGLNMRETITLGLALLMEKHELGEIDGGNARATYIKYCVAAPEEPKQEKTELETEKTDEETEKESEE